MKLLDEQVLEGNIGEAIAQYIADKKPLGVFFMGIIVDEGLVKPPEVLMSAEIRFDWLAGQLEDLARLYREKAKNQDYCQ